MLRNFSVVLGLCGLLCQGFVVTKYHELESARCSLVPFAVPQGSNSSDTQTTDSSSADTVLAEGSSGSGISDSGAGISDSGAGISDSGAGISDSGADDYSPATFDPLDLAVEKVATDIAQRSRETDASRRDFIQRSALSLGSCLVAGGTLLAASTTKPSTRSGRLAPVNFTLVVQETKINVTEETMRSYVFLDQTTFQKKEVLKLPPWIPSFLLPAPKIIKDTTDAEILAAAILAGSIVEMARTSILYPLLTLKSRVQTDINKRQRRRDRKLRLKRRLRVLELNAKRHFREGDLYAGLAPSLLVAVPATGVYFGVRDVVKHMLAPMPLGANTLAVAVGAAFVGDVVSLIIRTPVDTLAIRLQVASGTESHYHGDDQDESSRDERIQQLVGDWLKESIERLPGAILTDLPYLLLRITLNGALIQGALDFGHYELVAITTAILCGIATTPFDVARTRILMDSDDDPNNGIDGGSGKGLMRTFQTISRESDDGFANLFRGWFERAAYLGIGRAWLEPLQIVGYIAIRDAILLKWFD